MLEGLPPNDAARVFRFTCDAHLARVVADTVVEMFDPAEIAAAAFESGADGGTPRSWIVEIYVGPRVGEVDLRAVVAQVAGRDLAAAMISETVAEQDWVTRSLAGLAPVRAGRFVVHGRHDRAVVRTNNVALEIEAALAFGTGHHGTTRGCLMALDAVMKERRPFRVADLGTGTGVLAMAAAKALHRPIACGDVDAIAVSAARDNAAANGVGAFVRPVRAAGLRHPTLRAGAPYDLILANILARPLQALAPSIARAAAPGADLILSGLLPHDVPGILSRYGDRGFALVRRHDLEGWATLRLKKRHQP